MFDLLVKGGILLDPHLKLNQEFDIAIEEGRVKEISENINEKEASQVVNANDSIVVPGLIDMHTHVFPGFSHYGVDPDSTCLKYGATTVIDAGTSGALSFPAFKKFIIERSNTSILPFLHISSIGLTLKDGLEELADFRNLDYGMAVEISKKYRKTIIGIKIRVDKAGDLGPQALILAKKASEELNKPLMVHPGRLPKNLPIEEVLSVLSKGDIVTHCFPPPLSQVHKHSMILESDGKIKEEIWEARKRGIIFDVGHGRSSFSFETAKRAIEQDFIPDIISTDLHSHCIDHPVYDLPTTLSKFLALGLPLGNVIKSCTEKPAKVLNMEDKIGTLQKGAAGDLALIELEKGNFSFWDSLNNEIIGKYKIKVKKVIKAGKVFETKLNS